MSLVTPSGGLVYHLRAWRYAGTLWAPFRAALAAWLERALPHADPLILVGPSAGHCLPLERFRALRRVLVLEPDPLARRLLAHRLAPSQIEFEWRELLVEPLLSGGRGLDVLLERWPAAPVLFCNVLGQLQFALSDEQRQRVQSAFRERVLPLLAGRAWASFHDRWSLDWSPRQPAPPASRRFQHLPSDSALAEAWFGSDPEPIIAMDHGTSTLFAESMPRSYFSWQLTPRALHVVEGLSSNGA